MRSQSKEDQSSVAGGERRVYREQVRAALVVVPALPTAMHAQDHGVAQNHQTQPSEELLVGG